MPYEVEFTEEFEQWWNSLTEDEQDSVDYSVGLLEEHGVNLKRPHADTIHGSKVGNMRELRCQHEGRPYRVLYAFDPRRTAMLLIGGDKTGNPRWYEEFVPRAEKIYEQHLKESDVQPNVRNG
ncbi:hypothetical protein SAMN05421770_103107 [Granulicella rosea]|uniref:Addiction module toxin RelE n=1 Tax=Granulicella rosea TaxID=474952 RepID=A0A239IHU2_9BACT|nr:type II toxin-antitoxin system RelE/ParE family toxin [Granulicella rosea]SNS92828.1 hypothetical protein SAMN05421770_103107 [Granulicella rosea]